MKARFSHFVLTSFILLLSSCAGKTISKADKFPLMYESPPLSVLILPPINESTAADAKEYYATTIQEPLVVKGYYVFPYTLTADALKREGLYDSELIEEGAPLGKFREFFGADAVMFTRIKKWDMSYLVIASYLNVEVQCDIFSTMSSEKLWSYSGSVQVDLSGDSKGGLPVALVGTALKSAMADYVPYARIANYSAMQNLPFGKYHPRYRQDQNDPLTTAVVHTQ